MLVAYWHRDGFDIYRCVGGKKPVRYTGGSLDQLKPIRGGLGKKVLIVGRDRLFYSRKRYPPAPEEKLTRAVGLEVGDIFPLAKPAFYCRVFERFSTTAAMDIWAWDSGDYVRLKDIFPFGYVLPEDIICTERDAEIRIFPYKDIINMVANSEDRFLAGASYPASSFGERDVERFLYNLDQYRKEIKKIKIYGALPFSLHGEFIPKITNLPAGDYPHCIDQIDRLNLGPFKVRGEFRLGDKKNLIFRLLIYLILGYATILYMTLSNYDRAADEIGNRLSSLDKKVAHLDTGPPVEDYSATVRRVNEKMRVTPSPLWVMNMLALSLPEGSFINRLVLNENKVEVSVSSKDPLAIVKTLADLREIKEVRLKGAPLKDQGTGLYNFVITIELLR